MLTSSGKHRRYFIAFCLLCWSFASALLAQPTAPHQAQVYDIVKSGDGRVLAVTYNDYDLSSVVDFFDSASGAFLSTADLAPYTPHLMDLSSNGDRLLWTDGSSNIGIYNRSSGSNEIIIPGGPVYLEAVAWNPINDVIGWSLGSSVTLFDVNTQTNLGTIVSDRQAIVSFAWSPDGQQIVTSHSAGFGKGSITIQVWDVSTISPIMNAPLLTIDDHGGGQIIWSPDGTRIAGLESNGIFLYDLSTSNLSTIDIATEPRLNVIEWNPDGSQLATGGSAIRIWNPNTLQLVREIQPEFSVGSLQWSFDGQHIFNDGGGEGLYIDDVALVDVLPTADAGPDQTITDSDNTGSELVTLDGSGSSDPDGTIESYVWTENDVEIATGVSPQVSLSVGVHTITLTVTDDDGATDTDEVVITVSR